MEIRIKRIYEPPEPSDGYRLLVDRIWPPGVSKERASLGTWMREVGPSTELRRWFGHDVARWHECTRRYAVELDTRLLSTPAEQAFETCMIDGIVVIVRDVLIELEIHL